MVEECLQVCAQHTWHVMHLTDCLGLGTGKLGAQASRTTDLPETITLHGVCAAGTLQQVMPAGRQQSKSVLVDQDKQTRTQLESAGQRMQQEMLAMSPQSWLQDLL